MTFFKPGPKLVKPKEVQARPLPEIEIDYQKICQLIANKEYQTKVFKMELDQLYQKMSDLNQEASKAKALEAKKEIPNESIPG